MTYVGSSCWQSPLWYVICARWRRWQQSTTTPYHSILPGPGCCGTLSLMTASVPTPGSSGNISWSSRSRCHIKTLSPIFSGTDCHSETLVSDRLLFTLFYHVIYLTIAHVGRQKTQCQSLGLPYCECAEQCREWNIKTYFAVRGAVFQWSSVWCSPHKSCF